MNFHEEAFKKVMNEIDPNATLSSNTLIEKEFTLTLLSVPRKITVYIRGPYWLSRPFFIVETENYDTMINIEVEADLTQENGKITKGNLVEIWYHKKGKPLNEGWEKNESISD